jgi:nucleoside-diphosphate-sugar epimerase
VSRVLVTGGTGFIGAHTVAALLAAGHRPTLLVRNVDRVRANVGALGVDTDALSLVVGDMTDADSVRRAVTDADAVIHGAAMVTPLNRSHAQQTIETNVAGTRTVVQAALDAGCDPIVHVSSVAAVFDPRLPVIHTDLPPMTSADSPYTRSKALAEEMVRAHQAAGAPVTIVYPGGVMGPPAGDAVGEVAEGFISMLRSGFVALHDGGVQIVDVRDVAAVLVATLSPGAGPRRFMAGGELVSLREIGAILRRLTGRRMPVLPTPGAVFRGLGHVVDTVRRAVPFDTVFTAEAMEILTLVRPTDDSAVHDVLGVRYREPQEVVEATLRGLYAMGRLTDRQAGALAHPS